MSPRSGKYGPKAVISGFYGFDNCGDEAVLLAMVHCLRKLKPDIRIVVLSSNPEKTRDLYDVDAVNRWNPIKVALALLSCQLVLSGGGSLLQDVTSSKSLRYYLAVIRLAAFFRKKVMIFSQGIGPLTMEKSRAKVSKALNRCQMITVRDERSAELLRELGVRRDVHVSCDPVMALGKEDVQGSWLSDELSGFRDSGDAGGNRKPLAMVSVRSWGDNSHFASVAGFLDTLKGGGWDVLLVIAHYPGDVEALDAVSRLMSTQPRRLDICLTAREFLALTALSDRVFSMRLHGLICAFAVGTPMLGLSYDPKVDAFMEQVGQSGCCFPFGSFDSRDVVRLFSELGDLAPQLRQQQESRRRELRDIAWDTAGKAVAMLDAAWKPVREK